MIFSVSPGIDPFAAGNAFFRARLQSVIDGKDLPRYNEINL